MTADELNQIVEAIQKGFKGTGNSSTTDSVASSSSSAFSKVVKGATKAAGDLGKALAEGGGKVSDFSDSMLPALGGLGAAFTGIVGYIERTNDTFNNLSKVGAGFNGDLGQLRLSAAETRMGFDQFGNMIGQNSEFLASFAGGVNGGAKQFTALSKSMWESGAIDGFMNLGYTVNEANEFLMTNMKLLDRQARRDKMSTEQQVAAALELAGQMDVMAKLTGRSVKEQQSKLVDAQRDGATQSALRLLEKKGVQGVQQGFTTAMTALEAGGPQLQALFQDMTQTGAPMSEMTQQYMAANSEAAKYAKQMADVNKSNMDAETKKIKIAEIGALAVAAGLKSSDSIQNLTIGTYGQMSSFAKAQADVLEKTGPLINQMQDYAAKQGLVLGETITYQQAYLETLKQTKATSDTQTDGTGPNQDAQQAMNEATRTLADSASKVNTALADQIQSNDKVSKLLAKSAEAFAAVVGGSATLAVASINGLTPGQSVAEGAESAKIVTGNAPTPEELRIVNQGSQADKDAFAAKFGAIIDQDALKVGIVRIDKSALVAIDRKNASPDSELPGTGKGAFRTLFDNVFKEEGGPVAKDQPYIVGEKRPEVFVPNSNGNIFPNTDMLADIIPSIKKITNGNIFPNTDMLADIIPSIKKITSRIPAAMQQAQTGVPVTQAEKMAAAIGGSGGNGATTEELLQTTNDLLLAMLGVNTEHKRVGEKQYRHTRGAGNLMNGIG